MQIVARKFQNSEIITWTGRGGGAPGCKKSTPQTFLKRILNSTCQFLVAELVAEMLTNQQVMWKSTGLERINLT